jgi:hypothetical protein
MYILSPTAVHDITIQQCVHIDASHVFLSLCRPVDHIYSIAPKNIKNSGALL